MELQVSFTDTLRQSLLSNGSQEENADSEREPAEEMRDGFEDTKLTTRDSESDVAWSEVIDEIVIEEQVKGRVYANNVPRIFLETITARTAVIIIFITYFFFVVCEVIDLQDILAGFSENASVSLFSLQCKEELANNSMTYGCLQGNKTWVAQIVGLSNILSVSLSVNEVNITLPRSVPKGTVIPLAYNLDLWACYQAHGCGDNFANFITDNSLTEWHPVLTIPNQIVYIDTDLISVTNPSVSVPLFNNTFQNQESIPTNGLVKSYYIQIVYLNDLSLPDSLSPTEQVSSVTYVLDFKNRPLFVSYTIVTIFLFCITTILLFSYIYIVDREQKTRWLPEQRWLVLYIVALLLYQNPVYCVIIWINNAPPWAAYSSYFIDQLGQVSFYFYFFKIHMYCT